MASGSGFGPFAKGAPVRSISEVSVGDLLLEYSPRFDAENVLRVTQVGNAFHKGIFYARFVDPIDPEHLRQNAYPWGFALYEFELRMNDPLLWRAVPMLSPHEQGFHTGSPTIRNPGVAARAISPAAR